MAVPEEFERTQDQFAEELSQDNSYFAALRAHIHIEHALNYFLSEALERSDDVVGVGGKRGFSYAQKVKLAVALGMSSEWELPLNLLGSMRNKLAHRLDAEFSDDEMKAFVAAWPAFNRANLEASFSRIGKEHGGLELSNRDRFMLAIVSLRSMLFAAPKHWRNAQRERFAERD